MAKTARTVLVTGASRGLGLGIASQPAGVGCDVIALAR
jgi:short-subunit dehydrogenase